MVYFLIEINSSWNYPKKTHSIYMRENGLLCICDDYSENFSISTLLSELILGRKKGELDSRIPFLKE